MGKMARPTLYNPKYCRMILAHFSVKPYRRVKSRDVANDFPTLAGFAAKIGVHRETLLNWTEEHPEFFDAYKRAKDFQENFLVVNGLKDLINPSFGIFTAKNVLGWRDKQPGEADVVVNNVVERSDEELDARIKELKAKADE